MNENARLDHYSGQKSVILSKQNHKNVRFLFDFFRDGDYI